MVSDLDGTLVRGRSSFPYFMLVAFEAGGVLRSVLLLLAAPLAYILYHFVSEAAGIKLLIFVTFSGVKAKKIESVSRAVLPKFYSEDLHPESWRVFSSFGRRYVLTANPRIMVEVFAKECLGADEVIGSEIEVTKGGYATGFVKAPGVLVGVNKENALKAKFVDDQPDVGMGDRKTDYPFMSLCKVSRIPNRSSHAPSTCVLAMSCNDSWRCSATFSSRRVMSCDCSVGVAGEFARHRGARS